MAEFGTFLSVPTFSGGLGQVGKLDVLSRARPGVQQTETVRAPQSFRGVAEPYQPSRPIASASERSLWRHHRG